MLSLMDRGSFGCLLRGNSLFENDADDFPIKCPHCLHEFYEKVGRIKAGERTRCPDCGVNITHPTEQFNRMLQGQNKAIKDYLGRFMRLAIPKNGA